MHLNDGKLNIPVLEAGPAAPFDLQTRYTPMGDQPQAIAELVANIHAGVQIGRAHV